MPSGWRGQAFYVIGKSTFMQTLPEIPLVSIVTPSYNTGAFIEETLRSVEQQDYPRVEHIVLDSGSTDGTPAVLARYSSVRLIKPAPQGLSAKINHGFSIARGDIVAWLNADDFYLPGAITKAVEALKRNPQAAVVYCNQLQVNEHSVETRRLRTKQASLRDMLEYNYVTVDSAFIRSEALKGIEPVDARYPLVQDWDMYLRISKQFSMLYVDDWWSAFRIHEGQRSGLFRYDFWVQARHMTREHGGAFFPLFRKHWGVKLKNAGMLLRTRQFERFGMKLRSNLVSLGGHYGVGPGKHVRDETRNRADY